MTKPYSCFTHGVLEDDEISYQRKVRSDGSEYQMPRCRMCKNESARAHHHKRRDAKNAYSKEWRKNNKEVAQASRKLYVAKNPEKIRALKRKSEALARTELRDRYVLKKLIGNTGITMDALGKYAGELIKTKRVLLQLKRGVKEHDGDKKRRGAEESRAENLREIR